MAFDFPSSPSEGQVYGGYVYRSGVWLQSGVGVATAERYNRIVNGAMQHSQEWNFAASGSIGPWYPFDQWQAYMNASGAVWNVSPTALVTPNGSKYRLRVLITTPKASLAATDFVALFQAIEGNKVAELKFGSAAARQIVVRFGFKGPAGTYSCTVGNTTPNRLFASNFTISAAQANIDTVQTVIIPGDMTGTWATDNTAGLYFYVVLATGSSNVGADRTWSTSVYAGTGVTNNIAAANTFELFDVGLYLDPQATGLPPPWQTPDWADELLACQRYFKKFTAMVVDTGAVSQSMPFVPPMRVVPAAAGGGAGFAIGSSDTNAIHLYQTARNYQTVTINARM